MLIMKKILSKISRITTALKYFYMHHRTMSITEACRKNIKRCIYWPLHIDGECHVSVACRSLFHEDLLYSMMYTFLCMRMILSYTLTSAKKMKSLSMLPLLNV